MFFVDLTFMLNVIFDCPNFQYNRNNYKNQIRISNRSIDIIMDRCYNAKLSSSSSSSSSPADSLDISDSLSPTVPNHPSLLADFLNYILCPQRADVNKFLPVIQRWYVPEFIKCCIVARTTWLLISQKYKRCCVS